MKNNLLATPKTIFKIGVILILVSSIQSCFSNCNEIALSKENKTWFKPYLYADYLVFKGDQNNVDTFFLEEAYNTYGPCNKFELGPNTYNYAAITFKCKDNTPRGIRKEFSVCLDKDFNHKSPSECKIRFLVFDLDTEFDNLKDTRLVFEQIINPYSGKSFQTLKFSRGDEFSSSPSYIRSFNWSQKEGLMSFQTITGETFHFLSKR